MDTERKPSFNWNIYKSSKQERRISNKRKSDKIEKQPRQKREREMLLKNYQNEPTC